MSGLIVQIGANVGGAVKGIEEVSLTLNEQKAILKNLQKEYANLSTAQARGAIGKDLAADIKIANEEIKRLSSVSTNTFGSIGSGATKAFSALRSLAYVLPGIGIAGIVDFGVNAIASLFGVGEEADKTAAKLKELTKPIDDIRGAAASGAEEEISKVRALSAVVLDQTESYTKRNRALNELKEINKNYFGDLTLEKNSLDKLKAAVDDYTQALIASEVVKAFGEQIGKLAVELDAQERAYNKAGKAVKTYTDELNKTVAKNTDNVQGIAATSSAVLDAEVNLSRANIAYDKQGKLVATLRNRMAELRTAIQGAVEESLKFKPLKTDDKHITDFRLKIIEEGKRLQNEFGQNFKLSARIFDTDDIQTQFEKALPIINRFKNKVAENLNGKVHIPLDVDFEKTKENILNFKKEFLDRSIITGGDIHLKLRLLIAESDEAEKRLKEFEDQVNKQIQSTATELTASASQAFGQVLVGGDIKNIFSGFLNVIASGLDSIGKQFIATGIAATFAKQSLKQLFTNPGLAIAAGVGLEVAAGALRAAASKGIKGFAQGGLVFGPTLGLVGEGSGTSRSNPEVIAPLDKLKGMIGGITGGGAMTFKAVVEGRNLALILARNERFDLRST